MIKNALLLSFGLIPFMANAQLLDENAIKQPPKDWKIEFEATGDLNGDRRSDFAFILRKTDKALIEKDEFRERDFNPRRLVVFLSEQNGYRQALQTLDSFLPRVDDPEDPYLEDPFFDVSLPLAIEKGQLYIHLKNLSGFGTWWITVVRYQIRYKNTKFELIGRERQALHRAFHSEEYSSVNYLTGKQKFTYGINFSEPKEHHPKTEWRTLTKDELLPTLDVSKLKELP